MTTEGSGASLGRDGVHNEDAYLVEEGLGLYVVCDGASGQPAGEIAARTAVATLEAFVEREHLEGRSLFQAFSSLRVASRAVRCAMDAVLEASREHDELRGMATTLSMLLVHGQTGAISHVGDSRVYLHRDGELHQLTLDHELSSSHDVDGTSPIDDSAIDTFAVDLRAQDTLLLCTDGAEDVIDNLAMLGDVTRTTPRVLASRIVTAARRYNPGCDATVVVVRVRDDDEPAWLWLSHPPQEFVYGHALVA